MENYNQNKTAFLFPGQGSQKIEMGLALAEAYPTAKAIYAQADEIMGRSISQISWVGPEEALKDTANTQPALFVHSLATYRVFQELYPDFSPAYFVGHSLGELSALTAAGALSFEEGLKLVQRRGDLMKEAGEISPGSIAAILALDIPTVERICADISTDKDAVQVANDNCPGQVVISGDSDAVARALEAAKEAGARRAVMLPMSVAAHSHLMAHAQDAFNEAVNAAPIALPTVPVIGNIHAKPLDSIDAIRADLQAQLKIGRAHV